MANNKKGSSWNILRKQKYGDTFKGRDVYNDQQLDRERLKPLQKGTGRYIFTIVAGVFTTIFTYCIWTFVAWLLAVGAAHGIGPASNSANSNTNTVQTSKPQSNDGGGISAGSGAFMIAHENGQYWLKRLDQSTPATNKYSDVKQIPIKKGQSVINASNYGLPDIDGQFEGTLGQASDQKSGSNNAQASNAQSQNGAAKTKQGRQSQKGLGWYFMHPSLDQILISIAIGFAVTGFLWEKVKRILKAQNALSDTSDINQHMNDQHIMVPEEMMGKYMPFPDAGMHTNVSVSSLISHTAILNKGLKTVPVTKRYKRDTFEDGELVAYKGEPVRDNSGEIIQENKPVIDEKFMDDLFTASGNPKDKRSRKAYDPRKIVLHPGELSSERYWKKRNVKTVADLINDDWKLPSYEMQRPGGIYWVDEAPVNTMVLAITRAGKGNISNIVL